MVGKRWWMLLLALSPSLAWAQIEMPTTVAPHEPIVAKSVQEADIYLWRVPAPAKRIVLDNGRTLHIWAPPGTYQVELTTIAIKIDWDSRKQDVQYAEHSATLKVSGQQPDPKPDPKPNPDPPPPPPVTQLGAVIVEDAVYRTQLPYGQVQAMLLPDIREMTASFRLVDKDVTSPNGSPPKDLTKFLQLAKTYPALFLYDLPSGNIVWQGTVPGTAPQMRALLEKHRPKKSLQKAVDQAIRTKPASAAFSRPLPRVHLVPSCSFGRCLP